ncbi:MAG TPA: YcnI family protein [Nocardioides sp.]|nr:YcnI family protein [Nocardioides sp.]
MHVPRTLARLGATAGAAGLLTLGLAAPASAHVTVTPSDTGAGAFVVLTFSVPHGCEGSPTTGITIQIPEQILSVTPTRNPLYEVEKTMVQLDEPIEDSHGNSVTERVGDVTYTADTPLPDGERDAFELSLQLPDAAGETLAFPVIQQCEKGETAWVETPAEGQDPEELERPAPSVTITEATGDEHGAAETVTEEEPKADAADDSDDSDDGNGVAIAGLVVGAVGIIVAGTALARTRKQG